MKCPLFVGPISARTSLLDFSSALLGLEAAHFGRPRKAGCLAGCPDLLHLGQALGYTLVGHFPILMLGAAFSSHHDCTARTVGEAYTTLGLIAMLPSRPACNHKFERTVTFKRLAVGRVDRSGGVGVASQVHDSRLPSHQTRLEVEGANF